MRPRMTILALVLASLTLPVYAAEQVANAHNQSANQEPPQKAEQNISSTQAKSDLEDNATVLQGKSIAPAMPELSVNFPDVQKQINADLSLIQQQAASSKQMLNQQAPAAAYTNNQISAPASEQFTNAQLVNNAHTSMQVPPTQATIQTAPTSPTPMTVSPQATTMQPTTAYTSASSQIAQTLQPVALVRLADGSTHPVYIAPGQSFDPNSSLDSNNPLGIVAIQPLNNSQPLKTTNHQISAAQSQSPRSNDPAYSPQVKVYGNKTPTLIGSREEVKNHISQLQSSGAYSYNVQATDNNAAINQYYNDYYNHYAPYYDPYYGQSGNVSYYQDQQGKWHKILGFRYDHSINNYVPIYAGYGSCVGPDCPTIYDPNYPDAGMPRPQPNPQGPSAGQPPVWGPPPSYVDDVDPGFNHPLTRPNYPNQGYPQKPSYPQGPSQGYPQGPATGQPPVWGPPPSHVDNVDPGFNHPLSPR